MNRRGQKQPTLFQTWTTVSQKSKKTSKKINNIQEVIDIDESSNDDELYLQAVEESLAEYKAKQNAESTSSVTNFENATSSNLALPSISRIETNVNEPSTSSLENVEEVLPGFDVDSGHNWIYPSNYPTRDYQFSIVQEVLYKNTMVILPTGLGKTFIAAVVMYNFFRWYPQGKIIFMAPTKPLVAQQIEACFNIMGIPLEESVEMTGTMNPTKRKETWQKKRVFFITPHIMSNDLAHGICPAVDVKLLVFDEAHRAKGNYAYCQVINEVIKYTEQFRVLALSATPGSDEIAIMQVLNNLLISHVEMRSEDSFDIKPYTFNRNLEKRIIELTEEMREMIDKLLAVLRYYVDRLVSNKVMYNVNAANLGKFQLFKTREEFRRQSTQNMNKKQCSLIEGDFAISITLTHAYEMLLMYGMKSFYNFIQDFLDGEKGNGCSRSKLVGNDSLMELMESLRLKFDLENSEETDIISTSTSHPKLDALVEIVRDHFQNSNTDEQQNTRVMVFSSFRDSVVEITDVLNKHKPLIRAMAFTGQAKSSKRSKGISQKEQLAIVKQFRSGGYNTLVATCVGEEGLDIGDIDLIVCFDPYKSPIRTIQRMGRTGRKRQGRVVLLTTAGREESLLKKSQAKTKSMNKVIGRQFTSLYAGNPRMVPKGLNPKCMKLYMKVDEYKATNKRKKKPNDNDKSGVLLQKFLAKHGRKTLADDNNEGKNETKKVAKQSNIQEKESCGETTKSKNKKRRVAVFDDSSDNSELEDVFKNDYNSTSPTLISKTKKVEEISNLLEPDSDFEGIEGNIRNVSPVKDQKDIELEDNEESDICSVNADEFFPLDQIEDDFRSNNLLEKRIQRPIKSPPNDDDVFNASKSQLSPINYEEILTSTDYSPDRKELENHSTDSVNYPAESLGFQVEYTTPEKNYSQISSQVFESSPIITSSTKPVLKSIDYSHALHESLNIYTTTQLVEMVQQDSLIMDSDVKNGLTKLSLKNDEKEVKKDESVSGIIPQFDLNFKLDEEDDDSDVIPSSLNASKDNFPQISNNEEEESGPKVSFDLKFDLNSVLEAENDTSDGDYNNIDSNLPLETTEENLKFKTSTPLNPLVRKRIQTTPIEGNISDSEWESFPAKSSAKTHQVKSLDSNPSIRHRRKRRLHNEFLQTQAEISVTNETTDESEHSSLDVLESSFIDDVQQTDKSMSAVYLQSVKDIVGPKRFKLQFNRPAVEDSEVSFQNSTANEDYQLDDFCVANDQVEYSKTSDKSQHESEDELIANRNNVHRKRIVRMLNSSTEEDVAKANVTKDKNEEKKLIGNKVNFDSSKYSSDKTRLKSLEKSESRDLVNEVKPENLKFSGAKNNLKNFGNKVNFDSSKFSSDKTHLKSLEKSESRDLVNEVKVDTFKFSKFSGAKNNLKNFENNESSDFVYDEVVPNNSKLITNKTASTSDLKNLQKQNFAGSSKLDSKSLTIIIDSREINGTQGLISILRHQYKINSHVAKIGGCDYVVSTRMGVERKLLSEVANVNLRSRLVDRIHTMFDQFDRVCLIIEKDREKSIGGKVNNMKYFYRLVGAMLQVPIKLLHSNSQEDTARLLKELIVQEQSKGFGISVDVNLTKKEETLCRMYQRIPGVSFITALNFCKNFRSLEEIVHSSSVLLQNKAAITDQRANKILSFLKQNYK